MDHQALMSLAKGMVIFVESLDSDLRKKPELKEQYIDLMKRKAKILENAAREMVPLDKEGLSLTSKIFDTEESYEEELVDWAKLYPMLKDE